MRILALTPIDSEDITNEHVFAIDEQSQTLQMTLGQLTAFIQQAIDTAYVNTVGDIMTGKLIIRTNGDQLALQGGPDGAAEAYMSLHDSDGTKIGHVGASGGQIMMWDAARGSLIKLDAGGRIRLEPAPGGETVALNQFTIQERDGVGTAIAILVDGTGTVRGHMGYASGSQVEMYNRLAGAGLVLKDTGHVDLTTPGAMHISAGDRSYFHCAVHVDNFLDVQQEITSRAANTFRTAPDGASRGVFWHHDGNNQFYLMKTAPGDPNGSWDESRAFIFHLDTGRVTINGGEPITGDNCQIAGFASGNSLEPYMRNSADNQLIPLARRDQTVSQIRLSSYVSTYGNFHDTPGRVMTGIFETNGYDNVTTHESRQLQYQIYGQWYDAVSA